MEHDKDEKEEIERETREDQDHWQRHAAQVCREWEECELHRAMEATPPLKSENAQQSCGGRERR